jgi:hypothetical protein
VGIDAVRLIVDGIPTPLHGAGLVTSARTGRETLFTARLGPLAEAGQWLDHTGRAWEERLSRLEARAREKGIDS